MNLPTKDEINIYNSLDEIAACKHFLGKSLEQAEALFRENSAYYQEYLMWMGPVAFNFYLESAINYLKSDDAVGDSHLIECLYQIVVFRMKQKEFVLAIDRVNKLIAYVMEYYDKFEVNEVVYGDVLSKYEHLQLLLKDKEV
ncbi:MAG: hypothetical protein ABI594_02195 [Ginsengibacter sp.]